MALVLGVLVACFRLIRRHVRSPAEGLFKGEKGEVGGPGPGILYDGFKAGALLYIGISGFRFMLVGYFSALSFWDFEVLYPLFAFMIWIGGSLLAKGISEILPAWTPAGGRNLEIDKVAQEAAHTKAQVVVQGGFSGRPTVTAGEPKTRDHRRRPRS